jgi:hypothetical protein
MRHGDTVDYQLMDRFRFQTNRQSVHFADMRSVDTNRGSSTRGESSKPCQLGNRETLTTGPQASESGNVGHRDENAPS